MKDDQKSAFFRELVSYTSFTAQTALEDETYTALLSKLTSIDVSNGNVEIEYAKLRGAIDVLKSLKQTRERLVEAARSRQ